MASVVAPVIAETVQTAPAQPAAVDVAARKVDPLLQAEVLISYGRNDEARKLLEELEKQPSGDRPRDNQVQFLLGLLDMGSKDYDSAISRFRRILVNDPKAVRVRLELGRALFESGRYADAQRQFMYARAGKVPAVVRENIDRFLGAIRQRKTFSFGFSFSIAPDTNLNAGPATDTVSLYGLPFQLSQNAKANSGVGVMIDANAEWAPGIGKRVKWRSGILVHRVQYGQTEFDDMTVATYSGPQLIFKRWDINMLGNVSRRWYGERGYSTIYGPSADVTYYINPRLGIGRQPQQGQI